MLSPQEFLTATPTQLQDHLDDYDSLEGRAANAQVHEINSTIINSEQVEQLQKTVAALEPAPSNVFFTKLTQMLSNAQKALSFRQALFDGVQPEEINDDVLRANAHLFLDITAEQANEIVANISLTQAQHLHRVLPTLGDFGSSCPLLVAVTSQLSSPEYRANQLVTMDENTLSANGQFFTAIPLEQANAVVACFNNQQLQLAHRKITTIIESQLSAGEPFQLLTAVEKQMDEKGLFPAAFGFAKFNSPVFTASPAGTDTAASKEDTKAEQCGTEETEETEKKQEYSSSPSI